MFLYMLGPESDGYWAVFVGADPFLARGMIWRSLVRRPLNPAHTRHRHRLTREMEGSAGSRGGHRHRLRLPAHSRMLTLV